MAEWQAKRKAKQVKRDAAHGLPFIQFPSLLVTSGLVAKLKPAAIRVYLALVSRSDNIRRMTWVGVPLVAQITGLRPTSVMTAYRELKDHGLISRRRVWRNGFNPWESTLLPPSDWILPQNPLA